MTTENGEIFDGYTIDGYIAGQEGVYDALDFRYRTVDPLTDRKCEARQATVARDKRLDDEERAIKMELQTVEMVAGQIEHWDLVDPRTSEDIPVSSAAIVRYFPLHRYNRLMDIVRGGLQSDLRPDGEPPPETDDKAREKN